MELKMKQLSYTVVIIKPDTAANENKLADIIKMIEKNDFSIYERQSKNLTKQDVLNLWAKYEQKPFFQNLMDYMLSGPVEILLVIGPDLKTNELFKKLLGPMDPNEARQKAPNTLRGKFGLDNLIRNEITSSEDPRSANRDRDILELQIPVKEPDFQFDKYKITQDALLKFIFPPHLEHPHVTGRLDLFALYGPVVNYHSVDNGCFCKKCTSFCKKQIVSKHEVIRQTVTQKKKQTPGQPQGKLALPPVRLVKEQDLVELWPVLCEECKFHCDNYTHLTCGRGGQHIMADLEINQLINSINYTDLLTLLSAIKGSSAEIMMSTLDLIEPEELTYARTLVEQLFLDVETDYFQRMNFYDMQK